MCRDKTDRLVIVAVITLVIFASTGCDNQTALHKAKKTLLLSQQTWYGVQDAAASLKLSGTINQNQWDQFVAIDEKYRATHNAAVLAISEWETQSKIWGSNSGQAQKAAETAVAILTKLPGIIQAGNDLIKVWRG